MSAPASRVFRVVVTQEVLVVVDPGVAVETPEAMIVATDGEHRNGVDFGAIVRDAIQAEDSGPLMWITAGVSIVSVVVELEARP